MREGHATVRLFVRLIVSESGLLVQSQVRMNQGLHKPRANSDFREAPSKTLGRENALGAPPGSLVVMDKPGPCMQFCTTFRMAGPLDSGLQF